jgi:hypothetical protein
MKFDYAEYQYSIIPFSVETTAPGKRFVLAWMRLLQLFKLTVSNG